MLKKTILLLSATLLLGCQAKFTLKDKYMNKYFTRYDQQTTEKFVTYAQDERIKRGAYLIYELPDGSVVKAVRTKGNMAKQVSFKEITPPTPILYKIYKVYYPHSERLKAHGAMIGLSEIGISQEFDETGRLIKELDHEKKYKKHHYSDVLNFLDKQGLIDLKTGKGRSEIEFFYQKDKQKWIVEKHAAFPDYIYSKFLLDANTLEILEEKREQRGDE